MAAWKRHVAAALAIAAFCACGFLFRELWLGRKCDNDYDADPADRREREAAIIAQLDAMPDMYMRDGIDKDTANEAKTAVDRICMHPVVCIRDAMVKYREESYKKGVSAGFSAETKIMIITKYLFDIPPRIRRVSRHFEPFDGASYWMKDPVRSDSIHPAWSDEIDGRWPWVVDDANNWTLVCGGGNVLFTGVLNSMELFDYCRANFGRRPELKRE